MLHTRLGKLFFAIFALLTVFMVTTAYNEAAYERNLQYLKREQYLLEVAIELRERLPASLGQVERPAGAGAPELPGEDLQPIVLALCEKYPDTGIGYYSRKLDRNVAVGPAFSPALLEKVDDPNIAAVYETGKYAVTRGEKSALWDGKPVLAVHYPIYQAGQIIGHAFANSKIEDIETAYRQDLMYRLGKITGAWLLAAAFIWYSVKKFRNELTQFSAAIPQDNPPPQSHAFPEINALLAKISRSQSQLNDIKRILEQITNGFIVLDGANRLVYVNEYARMRWQCPEDYPGRPLNAVFPEAQSNQFSNELGRIAQEKAPRKFEFQSSYFQAWFSFSAHPLANGAALFFTDITQDKKTLEELARLEQLKLVSQLAAGVSHEIRNPMTTVRGYLQRLSLNASLTEYQSRFELMIEELDRANQIITEFLSLAKHKELTLNPLDLNKVIRTLAPLLEADAAANGKTFQLHLYPNLPPILSDVNEIRQLILNLVRNGLEAARKVKVLTYLAEKAVVLAIEDNGPGIPEEVMRNLGTPFITTKETGTGLGLSICYSIAKRHGAEISVDTGSKGTTFYIRFPLTEPAKA
ncbi:MAG TPA: ATP-binding protein [Selenomonadales bacterium]|nr:ATP-binding protein [Selenomonadales bacterium]